MANVLFRGTKTFWKTKNSIEIVLLEHNDHYALEIAAFEPVLAIEAPRIYLNLLLVYPLLNLSHTSSKGSQEAMSAISTFVFNRLYISKYLPTSKVFEVVVRREFESIEQKGKFELMMDCPVNLIPYPSPFKTHANLSIREKWRIPFILVRLLKGLPLRAADEAIYDRFAAGKSQPELVNVIAAALGTKITSEKEENLLRVAHSIVLDPQTPFPAPRYHSPRPRTLPEGFVESVQAGEQARSRSRGSISVSPVSPVMSETSPRETIPREEASSDGDTSGRGFMRSLFRMSRSGRSSPGDTMHSAHSLPADGRISFFAFGGHHRHQRGHSDGCAFPQLALEHPDSPLVRSECGSMISSVVSSSSKTSIYDSLQRRMGFRSSPSSPALLQHKGAQKPPLSDASSAQGEAQCGVDIAESCAEGAENHCEGIVGDTLRDASVRDERQRPRRRTFSTATDLRVPPPRHGATPRSYPGALKARNDAGIESGNNESGGGNNEGILPTALVKKAPPPTHVRGGSDGRLSELLGLSKSRVVPVGAWVNGDKNDF